MTMQIAVLADVHANLEALKAILVNVDEASPDAAIVAGDVVNRGPDPVPCIERILSRRDKEGWQVLKGNHEDFVLKERSREGSRAEWENEVYRHSTWTCHKMGPYLDDLAAWPDQIDVPGPDGTLVRIVHASNVDNRTGLHPRLTDQEMAKRVDASPAVFCVGHTHVPFVRQIRGSVIVNAGAVGLPFDRDSRASFALLEYRNGAWEARIIRIPYDRAVTERAYETTGYAAEGGPMIPLILDELQWARPNLQKWHSRYEAQVASGAMTVGESVDAYLIERNRDP